MYSKLPQLGELRVLACSLCEWPKIKPWAEIWLNVARAISRVKNLTVEFICFVFELIVRCNITDARTSEIGNLGQIPLIIFRPVSSLIRKWLQTFKKRFRAKTSQLFKMVNELRLIVIIHLVG